MLFNRCRSILKLISRDIEVYPVTRECSTLVRSATLIARPSENLESNMVTLDSVQKENAGLKEFGPNLVAVFGTSTFEMSSPAQPHSSSCCKG